MEPTAAPAGSSPELPDAFPLRVELQLHEHGSQRAVLEDAGRGKFYRLGPAEARFVAALMETGSISAAYQQSAQHGLNGRLTSENVERLCKWLATNGLTKAVADAKPAAAKQNPLMAAFFWKVPLVNPDRWLAILVHYLGWMFHPATIPLSLVCCLAGVLQMTGQWPDFLASYHNLFSSWRWLWLAVVWCVLKVLHEVAHGATCRRYGGQVNEAGLAMILLMPIAYVNVTSSWRFPSRWQRLHVTLAGIAAELAVAGVALFAWNLLDSLPLQQAAADVVLLASISSLLFNLNPLLKFDGYFAIADATGVDNLYSYGQSYARYFGGRYVLGLDVSPPKLPTSRPGWIRLYGLSAAVYRVFTVTGLVIAAAALFEGAGIVFAIAGVCSFALLPLIALLRHLYKLHAAGELQAIRLVLRVSCLLLLLIAPLWAIPAEWSWTSPAIVEYDPPAVLRTRSSGFVETIHVVDGQPVLAGQPILSLSNDELQLQLWENESQLAQVQQEVNAARWLGKSSELQDALTRESGLQEQIAERFADVNGLVLCAPCDGTVVSRQLALMPGTYVEAGQEIGVIGREHSKRLKLSISQHSAQQTEQWCGQPLRVVVDGQQAWTARLQRLETRADSKPPDPALLAINGGVLASLQQAGEQPTLCEPRVNGFIGLTAEQSRLLRCGQRAFVKLDGNRESLGQRLVQFLSQHLPRF